MSNLLDVADSRKRRELIDRINAEAQASWRDPKFRQEFAADLTESVYVGFLSNPIINSLIETQNVGFDDRVLMRETKGLEARWIARGGYIEASSLTTEVVEMPRDTIGVHVSEFTDKFATNFGETAQSLRNLALRRLENEVLLRQYALLTAGAISQAVAGLQVAINDAIDAVSAESESGAVTISGPPTAISHLLGFTGFSDATLEEIDRTGTIGVYRGARIVRLTNVKDSNGDSALDPDGLVVSAPDCGRVVNYGGLLSKEFEELDNWYWHWLARRDVGMLIHHPERVQAFIVG